MSDREEIENACHYIEAGTFYPDEAAALIRRLEKERDEALKALESFNPRRIGYGPSLSHDALNAAWRNAEAILTPKPKEPTK